MEPALHTAPQIKTMSYAKRQRFFWLLLTVFVVVLPTLIFYTTGYRLSFEDEETSIVTTGGMYITAENLDVEVYLDEEQVQRPRLFRSAYYIQNIDAGLHKVVVQRVDLQTWVKVLPVDSHIVIEAAAFNMPLIPHIRPIAAYTATSGAQVYVATASSSDLFPFATTTVPVQVVETLATTSLAKNEEYVFVSSLFGTSTPEKKSVFERMIDEMNRFGFATSSFQTATSAEEQLVVNGNMELIQRDRDLYAVWNGSVSVIPYYFCVTNDSASSTAVRYGDHVAQALVRLDSSTTTSSILDGNRLCRPEVKLDRLRQDVYFYDFFPNSSDLVLLQLEDGLYATEIDDRSWQNTQLIYPGTDFQTVIENNLIYIKEGDNYFEVITEIEPI